MKRRWMVTAVCLIGSSLATVTLQAQAASTAADARLLEAIDWYTGAAGHVDDRRARQLLLAVADDGSDALAQMWLARVYSRGRMGFDRDEARAKEIAGRVVDQIRALAAAGDVEATFLMGTVHDEGLGAEVDEQEAARWYRRAAARDHVLGVHNLGNLFLAGRGVPQSDSSAVMWWLRAARAGDAITQLRVGESYEQGRGVMRDRGQAMAWYGRAAVAGNAQARQNLERLGGR